MQINYARYPGVVVKHWARGRTESGLSFICEPPPRGRRFYFQTKGSLLNYSTSSLRAKQSAGVAIQNKAAKGIIDWIASLCSQ